MNWSAAWAWLVLAVIVVVYVVVFDVHAYFSGGATMSGQMRTWLFSPVTGPFAAALWIGVFVGLMVHFVQYRNR